MDEIRMVVPFGSIAHDLVSTLSSSASVRLRVGDHDGMWFVARSKMPGIPGGDSTWLTLRFAGEPPEIPLPRPECGER